MVAKVLYCLSFKDISGSCYMTFFVYISLVETIEKKQVVSFWAPLGFVKNGGFYY